MLQAAARHHPNQWPLSPFSGNPLKHAFTVRVPEPCRTQEPDLVALSLFADNQFYEPDEVEAIAALLGDESPARPSDPGTMALAGPLFGPFYLAFEEHLGRFSDSGNGQLDLATMQMDWACG